jgi:23S rRNA (adenine2503-C2)-methyltransferase
MGSPSDPLGLTLPQWEVSMEEWGHPRYRGRQIFDALHRRGARSYEVIRELPGKLRERLTEEAPLRLPEIVRRETSSDASAKYALRLADGALVEAVFMPGGETHSAVNEFEDARTISNFEFRNSNLKGRLRSSPNSQFEIRNSKFTICLSSQTGCAVDCAFCVTGRLGGGRNLTAGEILGQLYAVLDEAGRTAEGLRVVFMGMGEPFLNPGGVLAALDILFEQLSPRRVTVSTSGITAAFPLFAQRPRRPNLAVSINAADQETRALLMPISLTYPLAGVVAAMHSWPLEPRRRITAEYVLIAGANDSAQDAGRLARLLRGLPVKVNVIPLNEDPVYLPGWKRPDEATIDRFARRLADAGMPVTVRRSKGPDTQAACGQLKGRTRDPRRQRVRPPLTPVAK